jgi:hypothetical protein
MSFAGCSLYIKNAFTEQIAQPPDRRSEGGPMLRMLNKYCSNCLSTQRFLDLGACLICERCSKRLERVGAIAGAERAPSQASAASKQKAA